jgi:hypothetical protein
MKKILLYNSFPFHCEMFGFFLDYAKNKDFLIDIYCPIDNLNYFDFYKVVFDFKNIKMVNKFNSNDYNFVLVLTDSDWEYKKEWINDNTITIDHWYQIRNKNIKHHIQVSPFKSKLYSENFIFPIYNINEISIDKKRNVKTLDHINIAILGRAIPDNVDQLKHLKSNKIIFHIINCWGVHDTLKNKKNIKVYDEPITTLSLINILINSQYVYITDKNHNHNNNYSTSASIALSFTTGCQLIIPEQMNKHLRLKSAILYNHDEDIDLEIEPDYDLVYKEKEYFINLRNEILDKFIN